MGMINDDCLQMYNGISVVKQPPFADIKDMEDKDDYIFHTKFIHTVSYNKRKLRPIIEALQDAEKFTDEYSEYFKKRDEILAEYAVKDKEGNPMERITIVDGVPSKSYNVPSLNIKISKASKKIEALEKEYKAEIDHRKKQQEEIKEILEEEVDFKPRCVPWSMIPRGLDIAAMDGVMFMIEDEKVPEVQKKAKKKKEKPEK